MNDSISSLVGTYSPQQLTDAYEKYAAQFSYLEPVKTPSYKVNWITDERIIPSYDMDLSELSDETLSTGNWKEKLKTPKKRSSISDRMKKESMTFSLKSEYNLDECLKCFNDLVEKNIGTIYLSGSVALFLQGKITRNEFKDLDIVVIGDYTLDDDMFDIQRGFYPPDPNGTELKSMMFDDVKIDFFSREEPLNPVIVEYDGNSYLCQSYQEIIQAKLNIALAKMKDCDELLGKSFNIQF